MDLEEESAGILDSLDEFEGKVLEFDRCVRSGGDHRPFVHILFRLAHNLKGRFALTGRERSVSLLHACESLLGVLRAGGVPADAATIDLLVAAIDALRHDAARQSTEATGDVDVERELRAIAESPERSRGAVRGIDFALREDELTRLEDALASGAAPYILEKLVGAGMDESSIHGLPVFGTIAEIGAPLAERLKRPEGSAEAVLLILFATALPAEELGFRLFDPVFPVDTGAVPGPGGGTEVSASASPPVSSPSASPPPPKPPRASGSLPRILVADDEALPLVLLQKILVAYGRIDTASGGQEAVGRFSSALVSAPYDVVFLDIMMPDMRGTVVLREMRELERTAGVPEGEGARIVMCSALRDFETVSSSFREQCELYLIKPVEAAKVREAMAKLGIPPMES